MKLVYGVVCQLVATYAVLQIVALLWTRSGGPGDIKAR
jgi:hypothetical protein